MAIQKRQSELFAAEDWTKIYRALSQINFNASDPPSINAALQTYLQTNFPEDFNDWIVSSEFVAIIDLLSWIAGSLAFKTDISVRENFIDVAESRDSILRLARFLSYNPSRNVAASGIVKITAISTNDDVYDSFGANLNNQQITWNDPDNGNWYEQFIAILNNAFVGTNPYGIPLITGTVQSVATQLYRFNGLMQDNNLSFSASVQGNSMPFELCNGTFTDGGTISEQAPNPSNAFNIFNLNDGNGNGSSRTGFFMLFKQGSTSTQDYIIQTPIANQLLDVTAGNINQTDVWVQTVNDNGGVLQDWTIVPIVLNSNITYNALAADQRYIVSVLTRDNDQITLRFSDGLYGYAPTGNIRVTYRVSNGLSYIMQPLDIDSVQVPFYYYNPLGVQKTIYLTFSLQETVGNSAAAESIDNIRERAPQVFATQNRMVSGEDYNAFPLQSNLAVRIKAVNRIYSGQSRYIDLNDPTGTYQDLSLFEEDGIFFQEEADTYTEVQTVLNYSAADIISLYLQPMVASVTMANAVRDLYIRNILAGNIITPTGLVWNQSVVAIYNTTGWFSPSTYPSSATNLLQPGAQIQFRYPNGTLAWSTIIEVFSAPDTAPVSATNGPITLTTVVPTGSIVVAILPRFLGAIDNTTLQTVTYNLSKNISFSLSYDYLANGGSWSVTGAVNTLGASTLNGTSTLLVSVTYVPGGGSLTGFWQVVGRGIDYVFESVSSVEWFDDGSRAIDQSTGQATQDSIAIMRVNEDRNSIQGYALKKDYGLTISKIWFYDDGTVEPRRTRVKFQDSYGFGYPDMPDTFYKVIDNTTYYNKYLFWYNQGEVFAYPYDSNNTTISGLLVAYDNDTLMNADTSQAVGTEAFIMTSSVSSLLNNTFWTYSTVVSNTTTNNVWVQDFSNDWSYEIGRGPNTVGTWISNASQTPYGDQLAFHWRHYAPTDQRIDPSITNMHDIFVLTYSYDAAIRQWISNGAIAALQPAAPTELDLRLAFSNLEEFRMFSDGIVWRPVKYKLLFGTTADLSVQANFKVVRLPNATLADGQIKSQIIAAINAYFSVSLWDFGDTFYYTELAAYIHQQLAGVIASIVIVPLNANGGFGDEFEIESNPDEIFISTATVANIQIISSNTPTNLRIR